MVKREALETMLQDRLMMFGEWVYAKLPIHDLQLPHFFLNSIGRIKSQEYFWTWKAAWICCMVLVFKRFLSCMPVIESQPPKEVDWAITVWQRL